jgi:uncharacterized protein (TIGR00730 family)
MANICVFGASSRNLNEEYMDAAYQLGNLIAKQGWCCVNGAGSEGLMRAVSDGALDAGGEAVGVIPQFMVDNGWHYDRLTRIITTTDMHERKMTMAQMTDAVVALPGGCGTMEELLEVITWRQLRLTPKPIIVLNTQGYYDNLVAMIEHAIAQGFMKKSHHRLWRVVSTPAEAIEAIKQELSHTPEPIEDKY